MRSYNRYRRAKPFVNLKPGPKIKSTPTVKSFREYLKKIEMKVGSEQVWIVWKQNSKVAVIFHE